MFIVGFLIGGFVFLGGSAYCLYLYEKAKISLIVIQYAGGDIGFDMRWFEQ